MLDAPETALVALTTWLILASEEFSRTRIAACAGLAVGCGLLIKVQFPFFVAGIVLVAVARGGWRHRRGLAAFAATALAVGAPWYLDHVSDFREMVFTAGGGTQPAGHVPRGALHGQRDLVLLERPQLAALRSALHARARRRDLDDLGGGTRPDSQGSGNGVPCRGLRGVASDHPDPQSRPPVRHATAAVSGRHRHRLDRVRLPSLGTRCRNCRPDARSGSQYLGHDLWCRG